jgi:HTH-type transcriptional regulator / antitoxin HipB
MNAIMSNLNKYIKKRKCKDKSFAKNYDKNYADFKLSVILRELREDAGITQAELARVIHTQKSAISRIENNSMDVRLSTIFKIAAALGKQVRINIV